MDDQVWDKSVSDNNESQALKEPGEAENNGDRSDGFNAENANRKFKLSELSATHDKVTLSEQRSKGKAKKKRIRSKKDRCSFTGQQLLTAVKDGDVKTVDAVLQQKQQGKENVLSQKNLNAALLEACEGGRKFIVQKLVRFGANVNVKMLDKNSETPLHITARQGFVDIADFLLTKGGADVNAVDKKGNTALILAVNPAGSSDMLNLLVAHGAYPNHQNHKGVTALIKVVEAMDVDGMRILLHAQSVVNIKNHDGSTAEDKAAELGVADVFYSLVKEVQEDKYGSYKKSKALTKAVEGNHLEAVQILLNSRSLDLKSKQSAQEQKDKEDNFIRHRLKELIKAICSDVEEKIELNPIKLKIVESLIACGVEAEKSDRSYYGGSSSLHQTLVDAVRSGVYELVKLMCRIKNMNINKQHSPSALMVAAQIGRLDIIRLLFTFGADPTLSNYNDETALAFALMGGHIECAQFLIKKHKPSDRKLETAVKRAVEKKQLKSLEFLALHINFDAISQSLLRLGVKTGDTKIVHFLIDHGANINDSGTGKNPALVVALKDTELDQQLEMVKFLVKNGAHVNKTASFDSPLVAAIRYTSDLDVLRFLIEHGADVNEIGFGNGESPLTFALSGYSSRNTLSETLEVLLKAKADPNKSNGEGCTPLHLAVEEGDPGIVKQLVDAGADMEGRDSRGLTPFLLAASKSKSEVISMLKKCGANVKALDSDGRNALMHALGGYRYVEEILDILSPEKDQVNHQTPCGLTALILAAEKSHYKSIAFLLEAGADPHLCNDMKKTALRILLDGNGLQSEKMESVKLLIKRGALHSLPRVSCPQLYEKIMSGDRELVQLMVTHGMAPMCLDLKSSKSVTSFKNVSESIISNFSPLAAALVRDRVVIARYLLENWFLTPQDVVGSTHVREIRASRLNDQDSATMKFLDDHFSQPMRLEQLSFVVVSTQLGDMIGREERARKLPLPTILQNKLLFKQEHSPMDFDAPGESDPSEERSSSINMRLMTLLALSNMQERQSRSIHPYYFDDSDDDVYYAYGDDSDGVYDSDDDDDGFVFYDD